MAYCPRCDRHWIYDNPFDGSPDDEYRVCPGCEEDELADLEAAERVKAAETASRYEDPT